MLRKTPTGTWLPAWVPESTLTLSILLVLCSIAQSATAGYDGSMLNGLNILPSYTDYFDLSPAGTGLNTASIFIGGALGAIVGGPITDRLGRRLAIFWSCIITIVGVILQTAAQNVAMFVIARIILGLGTTICGIAAGVFLSETFPSQWRAWGVGLLNDFYYVGALIAAGITLGTGKWPSTVSITWNQARTSPFTGLAQNLHYPRPESPRWLVREGRFEDARTAVAQTNSNGNLHDPVSIAVYKEILDTLEWEKKEGHTMSPFEIFKTRTARKRFLIGMSPGPFSCIAGNIIASYYLGTELTTAGISDPTAQLQANVVLNVWCLACSLGGTQLLSSWGRKPTALVSQVLLFTSLFTIGGLTKLYNDNPQGATRSLIYGDVAVMFLFQGFYSIAWTPLLYLYPAEVMNYSIRANGLALSTLILNLFACVFVFIMPIGLSNIGWKMYVVNGSWDIVIAVLIAIFWVETKGKTLEEIDAIFDGHKHSDIPDVEKVRRVEEKVNVSMVEHQLHQDTKT
ncbi:putative hexose carrier protein [Xylariaceae sp. AK1471]|nr:putative hexose carrier protein [Xylariaceae sp. AK1471]